jgi:succinate dehydrogenase/fumarate reductase cytochrome b subunit
VAVPGTEPPPVVRRRVRWGAVAGVVVFAYVLVLSVALVGIGDRNRFNRWGHLMHSIGARLVLCVVVLAALFHTLDGLRRLLLEVAPSTARHEVRLRAGVLFLTWALAVPAGVMIVGPWVSETFR